MDVVPEVFGELGSQPSGPGREPLRVIVEKTAPVVIKAEVAPDRKLCSVLLVSGKEDPEWTHAFEALLESMGAEV